MDTVAIGKHNSRLAGIRKAIRRGGLTSDGLLPVEGPKLVREARAGGLSIEALFLREGTALEEAAPGAPVYTLDPAAFKGIQSTEHSQGIVALVRLKSWRLEDIVRRRPAPIVVLASLQDPGNVGTILRVAESFGAAGCIGLVGTASIHNSKVVRASAGSVFRLPHVWELDRRELRTALKAAGIALIGTSPRAADSIQTHGWRGPAAILFGNEGSGLTEDQAADCDSLLRIPHEPDVESLNSALAVAVTLYEAYRQRVLR